MRENCIPAWVEVVGSVTEKLISEFNEMREIFNISGTTLRETYWIQAADKRKTRCMRNPTTACQRANSKVAGPAVYKNIAEFNKIENSSPYSGNSGHTDHEAMRKGRPRLALLRRMRSGSTCWKVPYIGPDYYFSWHGCRWCIAKGLVRVTSSMGVVSSIPELALEAEDQTSRGKRVMLRVIIIASNLVISDRASDSRYKR